MRKKALVTGASRGIGKAVSRMLAKEGYDLLLVCRNSLNEMEALGKELTEQYGVFCETALVDVSNPEQVQRLFKGAGEIEVLVNNAGVSHIGLLTDMTVEQWREVIDTNLSALFYTCKWTVPGMVRRKSGKIINISSVWGSVGASMETAYSGRRRKDAHCRGIIDLLEERRSCHRKISSLTNAIHVLLMIRILITNSSALSTGSRIRTYLKT